MELKKIKPNTAGSRNYIKIKIENLSRKPLLKNCIVGKKNTAGKNNSGKITVRHKGGGHKKKYRLLNTHKEINIIGIICSIEYDPFRNAPIASVFNYQKKSYFYMIAPKNIKKGDIIKIGKNAELKTGHTLPLSKIPVGSLIHNVSMKPKQTGILSRSSGTFSQLIEKTTFNCKIKLSSNKLITLPSGCYATLGIVANENFFLTTTGKAGRSRWLNKRPSTRGVAMNPIDHPNGGGEGKKSGQKRSPWG